MQIVEARTGELSTLRNKDPSVCWFFCEYIYILFLNLASTHSFFVSKLPKALQHCNLPFWLQKLAHYRYGYASVIIPRIRGHRTLLTFNKNPLRPWRPPRDRSSKFEGFSLRPRQFQSPSHSSVCKDRKLESNKWYLIPIFPTPAVIYMQRLELYKFAKF